MTIANIILASVIIVAVFIWRATQFNMPAVLGMSPEGGRRLTRLAGWGVIVIVGVHSLGGVIVGRTDVSTTGEPRYAHIKEEPLQFWRQIALQLAAGALVGGAMLAAARRNDHV